VTTANTIRMNDLCNRFQNAKRSMVDRRTQTDFHRERHDGGGRMAKHCIKHAPDQKDLADSEKWALEKRTKL